MDKTDFSYSRKPAFVSFLMTYFVYFGIGFLLIRYSPAVSSKITDHILAHLDKKGLAFLFELPYGAIFSLPFLIYGLRTLLWNLMSRYEINESEIRFLSGSLVRKERFFPAEGFSDVSFTQNLIEAPFGVGQMALRGHDGSKLVLEGIHGVKSVVEALRAGMEARRDERHNLPFPHARTAKPTAPPSEKGAVGWVTAMVIILILPPLLVVLVKMQILTELVQLVRELIGA